MTTDRIEQDPAVRALNELLAALDTCMSELGDARTRAEELLQERQAGRAWLDIVTTEARPLVVEQISSVMALLAGAGGAWRREQAYALASEQVSINRIAAMFGVTRQRISALLRERARTQQDLPREPGPVLGERVPSWVPADARGGPGGDHPTLGAPEEGRSHAVSASIAL